MPLFLALVTTVAGVAMLCVSWRRSGGWKRLAVPASWMLVSLSAIWWVRFGGVEFGLAYAAIAVALAAWSFVAALGLEMRRPEGRRPQPRVARAIPGRIETWRTLGRAFVALPLAGTASLFASVLLVRGLPWTTANRYVFAIAVAPIIWGVLAVWVGMTARLSRVALLFAGVSATSAVLLLFVR